MTDLDDTTTLALELDASPACRVLVVDHDELARLQIATVLRAAGYETLLAAGGKEALRLLDQELCPIVITDWEMPDMDGIELCRNLRARSSTGYVYILLLTVRDSEQDVVRGLQAGADDYLVKGATTAEFLARISTGKRIVALERGLRSANRESRRLAITDALTGANNRRFLIKYLPREMTRSRRYGHALSLVMFDVDFFKAVNDTYGHDAGDDVLRQVVSRATSVLRGGSDWIARTGGEEFVALLPETALAGGVTVGEKIRRAISSTPLATRAGPIPVTVSVGVSSMEPGAPSDSLDADDLLQIADRALYASKQNGRNRTTSFSTPDPSSAANGACERALAKARSGH